MCEFIGWIEKGNEVVFLTNDDLRGKRFNEYKKENLGWERDIVGHGAIKYFYGEVNGEKKECSDFSTPENFPQQIVEAIKQGRMNKLGICKSVLNKKGIKEYKKIETPAWKEYEKIQQSALKEYNKIRETAFGNIVKQKKYREKLWK